MQNRLNFINSRPISSLIISTIFIALLFSRIPQPSQQNYVALSILTGDLNLINSWYKSPDHNISYTNTYQKKDCSYPIFLDSFLNDQGKSDDTKDYQWNYLTSCPNQHPLNTMWQARIKWIQHDYTGACNVWYKIGAIREPWQVAQNAAGEQNVIELHQALGCIDHWYSEKSEGNLLNGIYIGWIKNLYFDLGIIYEKNGQDNKALQAYQRAYLWDPSFNAGTLRKIADLFRKLDQYEQAVTFLENELAILPLEDAIGRYFVALHLGDSLLVLGKVDDAFSQYKLASQLQPTYHEPYINMAQIMEEQGNYPDAVTLLDLGISNPNDKGTESKSILIHERDSLRIKWANVLYEQNQLEEAIRLLSLVTESSQSDYIVSAWIIIGSIFETKEDWPSAYCSLTTALQLSDIQTNQDILQTRLIMIREKAESSPVCPVQ